MRFSILFLLVAACSSSSSSSSPDGGTPSDAGGALSCGSTISAYCGASHCDTTTDLAKQDKMLCPASLTPCGDYDVISMIAVDTSTTYYYFQGNLTAVTHAALLPRGPTCFAGPSTFTPPSCTGPSQTLPACQ